MTSVNDIRQSFLDYFARNGHEVVASSSLVPRNDPTLMFTNAGMVPFKNVFTGQEKRDYTRAVSSQKCVRAGGKHNDLDNVGYTARHHTFFEMLGNFSFGDYFKDVAIELAWNLLTKEFSIDPARLVITVFDEDEDAFSIWKKVTGFSDDKIIRIATNDNFWAMGATGPCGPCSEIFFDHGEKIPGGLPGSAEQDGDRYVEIWNLVFMQYDQRTVDDRSDLPKPSIDTGMGLERMAAVLQGTHDNYEIDLFQALIRASVEVSGVEASGENAFSHRVIADHLRASCFLIADGVLPSNEGRGYVLRRIMRRAMRHAQILGARDPMIYRLVPTLIHEMGDTFSELRHAESLITETLKLEGVRFVKTLTKGLSILANASKGLKKGGVLSGDVAFKLYDTYGFPLDLTEDALRDRDITVDVNQFSKAMEKQKADARKAWKGSGDQATETVWFDVREATPASEFLGYETLTAEAEILALIKDGKVVKTLKAGERGNIVVNQTPFYGESGGQVGDQGRIVSNKGAAFRVEDTVKKLGNLFVHIGEVENGHLTVGDVVTLSVDPALRQATRANHSATHLIHEALRQVLGTHVAQKGSLVAPDRLRFDFSHAKPMTPEELTKVEILANQVVAQNAAVETHLMSYDDALDTGAMALFGEKYGDDVRVVSMGRSGASLGQTLRQVKSGKKKAWSIELCGGTHVARTGDIGVIRLTSESASAAGVRRIEALTGEGARAHLIDQDDRIKVLAAVLKTKPAEVVKRVRALLDDRKSLERALKESKKKAALSSGTAGGSNVSEIAGIKLLKLVVSEVAAKDMKAMADEARSTIGSGIVVVVNAASDGKLGIVVAVTPDLTETLSAIDLVRLAADKVGGKGGGGRPDMAQAGGPDGTKSETALAAIETFLAAKG